MTIGKDKVGVLVNMDKELKAKLESIAKDDGRSLTNLINKILADYVEDTHKQGILYFTDRSPISWLKLSKFMVVFAYFCT